MENKVTNVKWLQIVNIIKSVYINDAIPFLKKGYHLFEKS